MQKTRPELMQKAESRKEKAESRKQKAMRVGTKDKGQRANLIYEIR
jgi:hypothetical protein